MSELPRGWVVTRLGDIAEVKSGVGFPKHYQGNSTGIYPVFKVGDVSRAYLNSGGLLSISENYVSEKIALQMKVEERPQHQIFCLMQRQYMKEMILHECCIAT
mgnify:CR=1 FL=1